MMQPLQCSSANSCRRPKLPCRGSAPCPLPLLARHQLGLAGHGWKVQSTTGAAAAVVSESLPDAGHRNLWKGLLSWWDVGVSENDKKRQPGKLSETLAMAWQLIAQEKKLMAAASFLMVTASVCELIMPYFYSKIICSIGQQGCQEAFKQHLTSYAAFALGFAVLAAGRGALFGVINNKLSRALRYRLYGVLLREPTDFHDVNEPGQLISRLTSDCYAITRCIATNVNVALRNLLQVIGGGAILAFLSPSLSGLCLAIFTVLWGFTILYGSYSRHSQRVVQDVLASSTACAEEALVASKVVRTFGTEQKEQDRYMTWLDKLYAVGMRQSAAWGLYLVAGTTAQSTSIALSLLLGGSMVYAGAITPEQLTSFMFYVQLVTTSSLAVCDQYGAIMEAVGASERVLAHLNDTPAPQLATGLQPHTQLRGEVEMRGVCYTYPNRPDNPALSGVDLWLQPGKLTALVGLSGSGKSTLVSLLQRLYDPTDGQVLIDGYDLTKLDAQWYRNNLGVVSQEPRLFSCSVFDNICYGCSRLPSAAEVEEAARAANAHEFIINLPQGYDTQVTDKLLSGGQRQRIALARALVRKPALLILDEATSALDAESEARVQQALDRAMQPSESNGAHARTVLVIAHRLSTVRNADKIYVLDKGKVAEEGTHAELLDLKGIYWGLVRRQQKGVGPADRDLSPRERDPPMLSSRDWDYGGEGSSMPSRDTAVSSTTSLRSGSPLPGIVEGSATAGADSARGFNSVSGLPQSPKAPPTPGPSRASTPVPSSAASLSGSSVNSFALSVDDEEEDESAGAPEAEAQRSQGSGSSRTGPAVYRTLPRLEEAQGAKPAYQQEEQQLPKGWRQWELQQQQRSQQILAEAVGPVSGNGSRYINGAAAAARANGNGNGNGKTGMEQGQSSRSSNGAGDGNGSADSHQQQQQQQWAAQPSQQQQQQLVGAANDIVPLGSKMSSDRTAADKAASNNKLQQAASHQ